MVSVDIIKPERIANTSTTSLETILRQTPGVEILDGQPGIRGGSGYSYGAGSRVHVLLDDLPILSCDVGDVKWDYLPVENIDQVEIIKGASSVLYGSSALNGVFNIRSRYPTEVPKTRVSLYSGLYLDPSRKETIWWDRNPLFAGLDFSHLRKIKNLDLIIGGNLFRDEGYREDEYLDRARMNIGLKHRSSQVRGLSYGVNMNGMLVDKSDFLLWRDEGSGALRQNPQSVSALTGNRFHIDPFFEYRGRSGDQHSLKSLNASLGLRFERYVLDGEVEYSTPVFRAGLNYQVHDQTYLRASFGQGYRFPSVAEKFTATNVGSLKIFPNPSLVSETGWSTEIGVKQGLKMGDWQGYLDLAVFWTEYQDMIEFVFAKYLDLPQLEGFGFMAQNVGSGRIKGAEMTLYGYGEISRLPVTLMAGYTFIDPVDLNAADTIPDGDSRYLKYRYRHSLKTDAEIKYKRFAFGFTLVVNSPMKRIDEVFTDPLYGNIILPGFPAYWEENNNGYAVLDARVLCNITAFLRVGLILKNALNKEYMGRPGDIQAPRNITLRLTADF